MHSERERRSTLALAETGHALGNVELVWAKKRMGVLLDLDGQQAHKKQLCVGRQLLEHVPLEGALGTDDEGSD